MTARDLYLSVRVQNYAGGMIRRIGADIATQMRTVERLQRNVAQQTLTKERMVRRQASLAMDMRGLQIARADLKTGAGHNRIMNERLSTVKKLVPYYKALGAAETAAAEHAAAIAAAPNVRTKGTSAKGGWAKARTEEVVKAEQKLALTRHQLEIATRELDLANRKVNATEATQIAQEARLIEQQQLLAGSANEVAAALKLEEAALRELNFQLELNAGLGKKLARVRTVEHIGRTTAVFGLAGTAAMGFAAKRASDFGTETMLAATQARQPGKPASETLKINIQLQKIILDQMKQFPATSKEMADSLYQIFSGTNIQAPREAALALEDFNKMAVAGGASLEDMTKAGIILYNNFPQETDRLNTFFAAVRYGYTNAGQLANVLGYIVPIAKSVGFTFKQTAADMAFMTRQTGPRMIRQDAQGLARLIQLLGREDVAKGLKKNFVDVWDQATGKMRPIQQIISDIMTKGIAKTPQQLLNFFKTISAQGLGKAGTTGTIQAVRIFMNAALHAKEYGKVIKDVKGDHDELLKSYEAMSQAPGVRWAIFMNQLKAMVIVLGQGAIPAFVKLGDLIRRGVEWWEQLGAGTKRNIGYILAFVSIAALLGGIFTMIVSGLASAALSFAIWRKQIIFTRAEMTAAGETAAGAGTWIARIGGQAGSARMGMAAFLGVFAGFILALITFRKQTMQVVDALGGLRTVLAAIALIGTAFALRRTVAAMITLGATAVTATAQVAALKLALMGLNGFVAIATILVFKKTMDQLFPAHQMTPKEFVKGMTGQGSGFLQEVAHKVAKKMAPWQIAQMFREAELGRPLGPVEVQKLKEKYAALHKAAMEKLRREKGPLEGEPQVRWGKRQAQILAQQRAAARLIHEEAPGLKITPALMRLYNNYVNAVRMAKAVPGTDPEKKIAAEMKAQNALMALKGKATKEQLAAMDKALKAQLAADQKALDSATDTADQAADEYKQKLEQATQTLSQVYTNALSQAKDQFGTLFTFEGRTPLEQFQNQMTQTKIEWGIPLSTSDLQTNLDTQLRYFTQWRSDVTKLVGLVPHDMLVAIQAQGEGAAPFAEALIRMSPKDRAEYIKKWKSGQHAIQVAARMDFNNEMKHWKELGKSIVDNMLAGMDEESAKIQDWIKGLAANTLAGLGVTAPGVTTPGAAGNNTGVLPDARPNVTVNVTHKGDKEDASKAGQKAAFHLKNALW